MIYHMRLLSIAALVVWVASSALSEATESSEPALGVHSIRGLSDMSSLDTMIANASVAIERSRSTGDLAGLVDALVARAEAFQGSNKLSRARADLDEALTVASTLGRTRSLARAEGAFAGLLLATGEYRSAVPHIETSLAIAREQGDDAIEAASLITLGNYYAHPKVLYPDRAIKVYNEATRHAEAAALPALGARAALNLARAALIDRDPNYTTFGWRMALSYLERVRTEVDRAMLLLASAHLRRDLDGLLPDEMASPTAASLFREADSAAEAARLDQVRARALAGLAALAETRGEVADPLELITQGRRLADSERDPELAFELALREARLRRRAGDRTGAQQPYETAVSLAAQISVDLAATDAADRATRFRERVSPAFLEYASLLLESARNKADAAQQQETLVAVRSVLERFRAAELTNYFRDPCIAASIDRQPEKLAAVRTAFIYPVVIADQLTVLVDIGNVLSAESVRITPERLAQSVEQFRRAAEQKPVSGAHLEKWRATPDARKLYDLLLRPVVPRLEEAGVDTLVFVPDSDLRVLPWSALSDGRQLLADRYAIAVVPAAGLAGPLPVRRAPIRPLICGLTVPKDPFFSLPNVAEEIASIHALYGGVLLKDEQCRYENLRESLAYNEFSVLHIASHAQFTRSDDETFLLTYSERIKMNDLERLISPSRFRDQPVDLVVLSACETASGDDRAAIGLAGAALKAGARSVLATLWKIDDAASSELVTSFYKYLGDSDLNKAQALRRAQQDLREHDRTEHPYYWAGFVMVGNWM
jgi:CHAT domain-containing protein